MAAFCGMRTGRECVMEERPIMAANRGGNWENRLSHISPESNRSMRSMNPFTHRRPKTKRTFQALVAPALAWVSPAYCAPAPSPWSWSELWSDPGVDALLLLLAALFWAVAHVWALLVVWAEARATRSNGTGAATEPPRT
jgi:hypothetical protein